MHHDGKLETWPFMETLFINKNAAREQILQNNHKHGSRRKEFKKFMYKSSAGPPKSTISHPIPKVNSILEGPYNHINTMGNTNSYTCLVDAHE